MAESLWHCNSKCLWGVHFKVGIFFHAFLRNKYMQISLSPLALNTYIHMAESLWHCKSKCLWGVHFKVGGNNHVFSETNIYNYISSRSLRIRIYIWLSLFGTAIANACGECISKWGELSRFIQKQIYTNISLPLALNTYIYKII